MVRRAKALPTAGQVKVKTKRSLQNFSKEYDKRLRQDKNINMKSANARSKRIIETSNNAQKVAKHQNKIALREKSRYGQTKSRRIFEYPYLQAYRQTGNQYGSSNAIL